MLELNPKTAGLYLIISIVMYIISLGYSVFMAVLNYKQSKVREDLKQTNNLLEKILEAVKK